MLRRLPCPARALWAAGLVFGSLALVGAAVRADEPDAPPADRSAETVDILGARRAGAIDLLVRGHGDAHVKFSLKNTTDRRLNVVLPPGLVASSGPGQGFQSMGLGTPTRGEGFGEFRNTNKDAGFRSMPLDGGPAAGIVVPPGQAVEFDVPSVCLNFGIPTPTPRDEFTLMDVNDYSPDLRVRKALRSLATLGTSQPVAQAVMWNVANGLAFEQMAVQGVKKFNLAELTLAARIVEAVDAGGSSDLIDPADLTRARVLVRIQGEGDAYNDAKRLGSELQGHRLLGLPVQVVEGKDDLADRLGDLAVDVTLDGKGGRVALRYNQIGNGWTNLGGAAFKADAADQLDGEALAAAVDRAVASALVKARVARRATGSTTLRIENRLPLSLAGVVVRTGRDADAPTVSLDRLGIAPGRSGLATIAADGGLIERVELNGL